MKEIKEENIEKGFIEGISELKVLSIAKDITELSIDALLEDGTLKDIPVVGWVFSLAKMGFSVSDRIYCKKILCFLDGLEDVNQADRHTFIRELEDEDEQRKSGERLLMMLNKYDDFKKATYLGKLYSMKLKKKITKQDFDRLAFILGDLFLDDLQYLNAVQKHNKYMAPHEANAMSNLVRLGLMYKGMFESQVDEKYNEPKYSVTDFGMMLNMARTKKRKVKATVSR